MVSRAKTSETELKVPAVVGKGQDGDKFSNQLGLRNVFLWNG